MRVPTTRQAQGVADLIETNNVNRFVARRRQAARVRGTGVNGASRTSTSNSAARRVLAGSPPRTQSPPRAMRAAVSGPAPSYFGFALSLAILTVAAMGMGVVVVIWAVDSLIHREEKR